MVKNADLNRGRVRTDFVLATYVYFSRAERQADSFQTNYIRTSGIKLGESRKLTRVLACGLHEAFELLEKV
jgi:hypothetical protein